MNNLLENLNKEQLKAVRHRDGPLLIIAGAGTGKTTIITQRHAYMIEQGVVKPDEILALTFTDKAAGEMEDRVNELLPIGCFDLWISTFHSFGEKILKAHGLEIGLPADFKLLNEFEQWALVKKNLDKFDLDYYRPLGNPTKFIHALVKHFSRAKDENVTPAEYLQYAEGLKQNLDSMLSGAKKISNFKFPISKKNPKPKTQILNKILNPKSKIINNSQETEYEFNAKIQAQEVARINEVANAYHVYQQLLLDNNALDFGDLINYAIKLFRERPAILKKYREQFKYILLDEFQDTNWAQYELVKTLAAPKNNLAVVGDDDQSIYKFRGASVSNILQFEKDFPEAKKIVLVENYRNTQEILDLSYNFIQLNNPNRLEWQINKSEKLKVKSEKLNDDNFVINKKLAANNKNTGVIEILEGNNLDEEVKRVVEKIAELKVADKNASWNDFAVLVRANDSARDFTDALEIAGLPYIFLSSRGLYAKPAVMDVIAYLKLLDNYHESPSLYRVLNMSIFGFSWQELADLSHLANKKAWSLYEVLKNATALRLSSETTAKAEKALGLIAAHTALARERPASEIMLAFLGDSGYLKYLAKLPEQLSRENSSYLNQFYKRMRDFEKRGDGKSVTRFLEELSLEIDAGEEGGLASDTEAGPEAIKIMTVHAAKGLEFKYVFIANLVDKRFPSVDRRDAIPLPDALIKEILPEGDVHLEEERRLFYVAMTRAKDGLYFSWAKDYGGARKKKPSVFLVEVGLIKDGKSYLTSGESVSSSQISNFQFPTVPTGRQVSNKIKNQKSKIKNYSQADKISLPSHFSYTQLAAFNNCPYQYRFAHILKIPVKGKAQFSFGKTMHAVLEKIFSRVEEKKGLGQRDLFGDGEGRKAKDERRMAQDEKEKTKVDIKFEEIIKLYNENWVDDWYGTKKNKEEYRERGKEILKRFHEKYNLNWPNALYLEKSFNIKIKDGKQAYTIRGVIDRIDESGGKLKIVDYKTGRLKDRLDFEDKEQLFIYQLAASDLFNQAVAGLAFYYLEANQEIEFLGKPSELEKVKAKIIATINDIKKGEFLPKPSSLCRFCDFFDICEFRQT